MKTAVDKLAKEYGCAFMCLALVKPRSELARDWGFDKPTYGILDFDPAFAEVSLRWGDGSSQTLTEDAQLNDLILLPQFDEAQISVLFD